MIIFTIVFGKIANLNPGDAPYPLLVLTGLLPWLFISSALIECGNSLINNSNLITKIYFPRLILPFSSLIIHLLDLIIACSFVVLLMIYYKISPTWNLLFLPLFVVAAILLALSFGLWFAAINVRFWDFRVIAPFILQLGIYASPVGYSTNLIPEKFRLIYFLNPAVGIIDGFRWCILSQNFDWKSIAISFIIITFTLTSGIFYFRRSEKNFSDYL